MKWFNWILAVLAVAVLMVTLYLVGWLRRQLMDELNRDLKTTVASFESHTILHGPGGRTLVHFDQAEQLARRARSSPYIGDLVVTKIAEGRSPTPIIPFTLLAEQGEHWQALVEGWPRFPLGSAQSPWGYIYLQLDRSKIHSVNWAMIAIILAITLMLVTLLARLWSQQSSLSRTFIELDARRRELIRLERLALAGQLSAGLLHDLRKPVLNIQHNLEELGEALADYAAAAVPLQELRQHTRFFFQLLSDSQIERFVQSDQAGEEYVDLSPLIDLSMNLVRYERRGVDVVRREPDTPPPVLAQPFRIIQLFSNLILNAYQALDGRGLLTIETRTRDGMVEVSFTDNGSGIPAESIDHVFDPFFTTKPEGQGTGMGLPICRMIVEDLGGSIHVESAQGGPTTFTVRLPADDSPQP